MHRNTHIRTSFLGFCFAWASGIGVFSQQAIGEIATYMNDSSEMGSVTNFASFNRLIDGQSLLNYQEDGLVVSVDRDYFYWNAPGMNGSDIFYAGTGSLELVEITKVSGENFDDLDMQISSGWTASQVGTVYLWIQLYDDGDLVFEGDLNSVSGKYVGIQGGGFDRVLIGSYVNAGVRDGHDPFARNAIAIDNLSAGTRVPTPGGVALLGLGGMIGCRRRR